MRSFVVLTAGVLVYGTPARAETPKPPRGITHITIGYRHSGISGVDSEYHYDLTWDAAGLYVGTNMQTVSGEAVTALLASLTDLQPAEQPLRCNAMSDNNSTYTIRLDSKPAIDLSTQSSCQAHSPWNVVIGDKRYFQVSGAIDAQIHLLLQQIDPPHWSPSARTDQGSVPFLVATATSAATQACMKDLELRGSKRLSAPLSVSSGNLLCDLSKSKDCAALELRALVTWAGVEIDMTVDCAAGKAALPDDLIAQLRPLVDGKLMRTIVSVTKSGAPRLLQHRGVGPWDIGRVPGLSSVAYDAKRKRVYVRTGPDAIPSPLWKALGISDVPAEAELTLDGKRVK